MIAIMKTGIKEYWDELCLLKCSRLCLALVDFVSHFSFFQKYPTHALNWSISQNFTHMFHDFKTSSNNAYNEVDGRVFGLVVDQYEAIPFIKLSHGRSQLSIQLGWFIVVWLQTYYSSLRNNDFGEHLSLEL